MVENVLDGVNDHLHKLVTHICQVLQPSCIWQVCFRCTNLYIHNTSQWFPSWVAWTHLWSLLAHVHAFRGVRPHVISNPILHLMCLKLAICFVSYCLFDLSCRSKLCPFWNFLLEGLVKNCTTWCFSFHTSIMFPIGMACHLIFTSVNLSKS